MTRALTIRIAEVRLETDPGAVDLADLQRALEAAMTRLGSSVQAMLAGREGVPERLVLPELVITAEMANAFAMDDAFIRLADRVLSDIESRMKGTP